MNYTPQISYDQNVELTFHNIPYMIHCYVNNDVLYVEAEQKNNADRWIGEFTATALEEMTYKTGNIKKFPTFLKMLASALATSSDSVSIDLLTFQDLEQLKQRKVGDTSLNTTSTVTASNKRYLILTYIVEFDKVHYPMPLRFESNPDPARLKALVSQLREETNRLSSELIQARAEFSVVRSSQQQQQQQKGYSEDSHTVKSLKSNIITMEEERTVLIDENKKLYLETKKLRQIIRAISLTNRAQSDNNSTSDRDSEIQDLKLRLAAAVDGVNVIQSLSSNESKTSVVKLETENTALLQEIKETRNVFKKETEQLQQDQRVLADELEIRIENEAFYRRSVLDLCAEFGVDSRPYTRVGPSSTDNTNDISINKSGRSSRGRRTLDEDDDYDYENSQLYSKSRSVTNTQNNHSKGRISRDTSPYTRTSNSRETRPRNSSRDVSPYLGNVSRSSSRNPSPAPASQHSNTLASSSSSSSRHNNNGDRDHNTRTNVNNNNSVKSRGRERERPSSSYHTTSSSSSSLYAANRRSSVDIGDRLSSTDTQASSRKLRARSRSTDRSIGGGDFNYLNTRNRSKSPSIRSSVNNSSSSSLLPPSSSSSSSSKKRESMSFRAPASPNSKGSGHGGIPKFNPTSYIQNKQRNKEPVRNSSRSGSLSNPLNTSSDRLSRPTTPNMNPRGKQSSQSSQDSKLNRSGDYSKNDTIASKATKSKNTTINPLMSDIEDRLNALQSYLQGYK